MECLPIHFKIIKLSITEWLTNLTNDMSHHHFQYHDKDGRWGAGFAVSATTLRHWVRSCAESRRSSTASHVQSLMLSSHIFLGLPLHRFSSTEPWNNSLEMMLCLKMCPYHSISTFFSFVGLITWGLPLGRSSVIKLREGSWLHKNGELTQIRKEWYKVVSCTGLKSRPRPGPQIWFEAQARPGPAAVVKTRPGPGPQIELWGPGPARPATSMSRPGPARKTI